MADDPIASALSRILLPLEDAVARTAALRSLLASLGIEVDVDGSLHAEVATLLGVGPALADLVAALDPFDAGAVLAAAERVFAAVDDLRDLEPGALATLPAPLDDTASWARMADDLPVQLLAIWLDDVAPMVLAYLEAGGVVTREDAGPHSWVPRFTADLTLLGRLVTDPLGRVRDHLGWGAALDWERLLGTVASAAQRLGPAGRSSVPQQLVDRHYGGVHPLPTEARSLAIEIGPLTSVDRSGRGALSVSVTPVGDGALSLPTGVHVGLAGWHVPASAQLTAGAQLLTRGLPGQGSAGVVLTPDGTTLDGALPDGGAGFTVRHAPSEPYLLLGSRDGTHIELGAAGLSVDIIAPGGNGAPELAVGIALDQLRLVMGDGAFGSFLSLFVGALDPVLDLALQLSTATGARLNGSPGLVVWLPETFEIGVVTLHDLAIALEDGDQGGIVLRLTGALRFDFGPFAATVDGVGLDVELLPGAGGNLGPIDVRFAASPLTGMGLALEAGEVSGSGFLAVDGDRYVGGISVDVVSVGLDAFTIIDTSLPGGSAGFALFATLTLRFPSIPLGFGFSLSGLGGILALNRGVDAEALALGLRDGAADAVLFPDDPARDAPTLVRQLDEYFPLLDGNTVVGPIAEISWGVGGILTGQLGAVVSLPQGLIVLLGSIEAVLPHPDAPVLELHLDTLGALDLAGGTLLVVASLYDSRLLGVIELSGDAAVYVSWLTNPYFLLSVGGFHPGFQPPSCVPSVIETLRPMRAEVQVGSGVTAALESYFAVTSNTVQFGGGFEIEASDDFLGVTYTARGWFEFDVLVKFSPFVILADASAGVGVYADDRELLGVSLSVHLEGPEPWYATGAARFKFFVVNVTFDFAIGGHAPPVLPPTADVLDLIRAELDNPAAWAAERGAGITAGLTFAGDDVDECVRPDDLLVARQTVAPFDRPLARFGEATPLQDEVTVTSTSVVQLVGEDDGPSVGDLLVEQVQDWFAPALYEVMPDHARLSAPSYELMPAGVSIGGVGVALPSGDRIAAPEGHETEVWEPASDRIKALGTVVATRDVADVVTASAAGWVTSTLRGTTVDVARVTLGAPAYVAIDPVTADVLSDASSYGRAVAAAEASGGRVVPFPAAGRT